MTRGTSELARQVPTLRAGRARGSAVYGLVLHTTGSSIVQRAIARGEDPLEHAVDYYLQPDAFHPHYVIGWDGTAVQVADESIRAPHVGFGDRPLYLSGEWVDEVKPALHALWRAAWPAFQSPAHLFPGPSPNDVYVGAELLPIAPGRAEPAYPGATFTVAQHQQCVLLARDVAERQLFPTRWADGPRLLGHEDLTPLSRGDAGGGWDPGALRAAPRLALRWIRELAAGRDPGGPPAP